MSDNHEAHDTRDLSRQELIIHLLHDHLLPNLDSLDSLQESGVFHPDDINELKEKCVLWYVPLMNTMTDEELDDIHSWYHSTTYAKLRTAAKDLGEKVYKWTMVLVERRTMTAILTDPKNLSS